MCSALILLLLLPLDIWFVREKGGFVRNIFQVLSGKKSWVGCQMQSLELMQPGVLHPVDAFAKHTFSEEMIALADSLYTRDYKVKVDMMTMLKGFRLLGR